MRETKHEYRKKKDWHGLFLKEFIRLGTDPQTNIEVTEINNILTGKKVAYRPPQKREETAHNKLPGKLDLFIVTVDRPVTVTKDTPQQQQGQNSLGVRKSLHTTDCG